MNAYKCAVKKCRGEAILTYYDKAVCAKCWEKHCDENNKFDLKEKLNIKE